jgi:MoaA/NifB/PqqE/SkfB family radical SAM enzyme
MRTALLSLHSHGDRSFLDDHLLAHLSGALRALGHANELVVVALDGAAPIEGEAFAALVAALRAFDTIVYERTWTARIPDALGRALPDHTLIHCRGEHALADPPGRFVCEERGALPALLEFIAGRRATLPARTIERTATGWRPGLGATGGPTPRARPNLRPIIVNPAAFPAARTFSIDGNLGCPYQADARANPRYAGVAIPDGIGRGCAFCTTGNHHEARGQAELVEDLLGQLRHIRTEAPEIAQIVLRDQSPMGYLVELLEACGAAGVGGFTLMLQTRADWLLAGARRFQRGLDAAARAGITITPFLVGIESFAQDELDRFNKGVTVATNLALLAALRAWAAHPAFDLAGASFGFILFTPWTTMADLRANRAAIAETRLDQLRGQLLRARVRLYPDTALYYLAARDGLLVDDAADSVAAARYGYYPDHAWRFADPVVARFAALAAAASEATGGKDELRLFGCLLDAFAAAPAPTLDEVLRRFRAPPPAPDVPVAALTRRSSSRRTVTIDLGRGCGAPACALCARPGPGQDVPAALRGGGGRVVIRGAGTDLAIAGVVATARAQGFGEIVVAGHVLGAEVTARLAALGVDAVLVPIASQVAVVHDRIVGAPGGLVAALVAIRALAAAGVAIEVEVPVIAARLQDLAAVVELAVRAVPAIRAIRFVVPRHPVPAALAPPPLDELGARLDAAIARAHAAGLAAPLEVTSGVPMCAVLDQPRARAALRFDPRRASAVGGAAHVAACAGCAVRGQCPGVPAAYVRAHGARQVRAVATRPRDLYAQRTTPRRSWTDDERAAARQAGLLVLRPTVHCNQDCAFCSANESTPNVWADPDAMRRAIARAARRGVERISFSGGEPTLARELVSYVAIARRSGVRKIELVTNGVLLDRPARVAELAAAGLTHAFVSLHGHDEIVARAATRKEGDFARTVAAIGHLHAAGVLTVINHVISAHNYRFLARFVELVHARFGGGVMISFAFVTPQYKALEHPEVVPRLTEVQPYLHAALWRALDLGQPVVVGSRQGVPPCLLGPFAGWSDVLQLAHEARAEDAPQKQQGPRCGSCAYARVCTGLWRPYVARFGTDELSPIAGAVIDDAARTALLAHARRPPWGQPMRFDEVAPALRDRAAEAAGPPTPRAPGDAPEAAAPAPIAIAGARPARLLIVGSGPRARRLAEAAARAGGLAIAGVCSPHAPELARGLFEGAPRFTELADALERTRPDAVVIASATPTHAAAARAALVAALPVLLEKPIATDEDEAIALAALGGDRLWPAHSDRFAAGLDDFFAAAAEHALAITRHSPTGAPEVPLVWSRPALYESLYHLLVLAHRHAGADALAVARVQVTGAQRLERLRVELTAAARPIALTWELGGPRDALALRAGPVHWHRVDRAITLDLGAGAAPVERRGGEVPAMLAAFRDWLRARATAPIGAPVQAPVRAIDGAEVMRATRLVLDAMADAGAPFVRPGSPRHAASRSLARRYDG